MTKLTKCPHSQNQAAEQSYEARAAQSGGTQQNKTNYQSIVGSEFSTMNYFGAGSIKIDW